MSQPEEFIGWRTLYEKDNFRVYLFELHLVVGTTTWGDFLGYSVSINCIVIAMPHKAQFYST